MRHVLFGFLLLAACGPSGSGAFPDPPYFSPDGTWAVAELARVGDTTPVPVDPGVAAEPFRPLVVGMEFTIAEGALRDATGALLYERWRTEVDNVAYQNYAPWNALVFQLVAIGSEPCSWHEELVMQGHMPDMDTLIVDAAIVSDGDCTDRPPLASEATGMFRFKAVRVSAPQAAEVGR